MPWLPLLDQTLFTETAARRVSFLETFSERIRNQSSDLAETEYVPESGRLSASTALTEAVAISFATNQTGRGLQLARRALEVLPGIASPIGGAARLLLLSSLLRDVSVFIGTDGVAIEGSTIGHHSGSATWAAPVSVIASTMGPLLASAMASLGNIYDKLGVLHGRLSDDSQRLAQSAAIAASEAAVVPLFGVRREPSGKITNERPTLDEANFAFTSFLALHERYAASLRLANRDEYRWRQLRTQAPLIDWPLLLLHLAVRRHQASDRPLPSREAGLPAELAWYLNDLAKEIDDGLHGSRGPGSRGGGPTPQRSQQTHQSVEAVPRTQTMTAR